VTIKAGTFMMGSPDGTGSLPKEPCRSSTPDFEVLHQVTLTNDFEIQNTEVTQGQFKALLGYNPSKFKSCGTNCPVEQVTWHEAAAYCNALSMKQGLASCYKCSGSNATVTCQEATKYAGKSIYECPGFRLPTDAEWEHAYRGGTTTSYYNGKNDGSLCKSCTAKDSNADKIGWYCYNANSKTHPTGLKQPNSSGLYDMAGNVWEWCHDRDKRSLGTSAVVDPWGVSSSAYRVLRGGSYDLSAELLRASVRFHETPTKSLSNRGFRPVRTILPKPMAHWKFDEGTGIVANDSSGNGNDGTISGAAWTLGVDKGALKFDGSNDVINVPHSASLNISTAITIASWAYPEADKDMGIVCKGVAGTSRPYNQTFQGGKFYAGGVQTGTPWPTKIAEAQGKTGSTQTKKWTHVVHTYDGAHVKLYQDGKLVATDSKLTQAGNILTDSGALLIGANHNPGYSSTTRWYWQGMLDDVRIYNRALTASQVRALYDEPGTCSDNNQNALETDIDCGGSRCNKCADTKTCSAATDCLSGICANKVCAKGCVHQPVVKDCYKDASGVEWCKVPGGCYQHGSPSTELCRNGDESSYQVSLGRGFYIQATPVTQGQFQSLQSYNDSSFTSCGLSCPVESLTWHEAVAYCNSLSAKTSLPKCYQCTGSGKAVACQEIAAFSGNNFERCPGYRLPTQIEKEYAHRAGTKTAYYNGGISTCTGKDLNAEIIGWYLANSNSTTHPVGKKIANAWGLYDMAGNVWEWCHNWYQTNVTREVRGGSYADNPNGLRAADRGFIAPTVRNPNLGFRCVRTAVP